MFRDNINYHGSYSSKGLRDVKLRLIGVPLLALLIPITFFDCVPYSHPKLYLTQFIINLIHVFIYWEFNRALVIYSRKKYPLYQQYSKRLFFQTSLVILGIIFLEYISKQILQSKLLAQYLIEMIEIKDENYFMAAFFSTFLVMAIYESMYAFDMWSLERIEAEQLKKENTQAQLSALKSQVNPHFLFNSLNTLAALIPEDRNLAVQFVEKLSKVYRFILEIKDNETIPVKEELIALDAYSFLLKTRFKENIIFNINIPEDRNNNRIIPLSIQMLVENAIKHNIISNLQPLEINIFIEDDFLVVSNNLQLRKYVNHSTKMGLDNIQRRYQLTMQKTLIIESNDTSFIVKLPLKVE